MQMKEILYLSVGDVRIGLRSDVPLGFMDGTAAFRCEACLPDVWIDVIAAEVLPATPNNPCGDDGIFQYYQDGSLCYKKAKAGQDGAVSLTVYAPDFSRIELYLNEGAFPDVVQTADKVLQLLPMRQMLAHFQAMLLHSSRIAVCDKAILFTAPSGTGKTTQAKLWNRFEKAEIVSNDRTILRKQGNDFSSYGYPVDGSSPIYSRKWLPLGAIVVLCQGAENHIRRLPVRQALKCLTEQTAMDFRDTEERMTIQQLWLDLLAVYPVYQLICTPDQDAVTCLRKQLEKDEVIAVVSDS